MLAAEPATQIGESVEYRVAIAAAEAQPELSRTKLLQLIGAFAVLAVAAGLAFGVSKRGNGTGHGGSLLDSFW